MTNDIKEASVGVTAGIGGAIIHWLQLAGDIGSAVASVLGAITAAVVFLRVINHKKQ